ncbi:MAG: 4-hydroxythreonine-4-phosphate dehydrogenase PdxA [Bacteroidales bacterium]
MNNKIVVGITQGDSNSISYEVIIKALSDLRMLEICTPVIYGSSKIFGFYKKQIPDLENFSTNVINSAKEAHPKRINIINCVPENLLLEPGKQTEDGSKGALIAIEEAVKDLKNGHTQAIVTAPFNKSEVHREGFSFCGHTEYFTKEFGAKDSLMFLVSDLLKVGLVTNHIPVSQVSKSINSKLIVEKLDIMNESLKRDFAVHRPKIAVLALNPHCGDQGLLGNEEEDIIKPAIKEASDKGILVFGPYSPDGFFASDLLKKFDAVLSMYHDQGLIPFKTLSFENGVNFTAGLSIIRTSPDHGTAYDLVGKNKANPASMISAIYTACDIYKNRIEYDQLRSNPLSVETPSDK